MKRTGLLVYLIIGMLSFAEAQRFEADIGGLKHKRESVFEFTQKPTFKKLGTDRYEIRFASKGYCDVSVAILNSDGRIIRHLVSGVLGANAPEPLQKNSLKQLLVWDGKNNLGRYVEDPDACKLRVCLGLKPTFDKVLISHPNRLNWATFGLAADKDGVYLLNVADNKFTVYTHTACNLNQILVYDHDGNYKRTILPYPRDKTSLGAYPASGLKGQGKPAPGEQTGKAKKVKHPPTTYAQPNGKTVISPGFQGSYSCMLEPNAFCVADGILTGVPYTVKEPQMSFFQLGTDGSAPKGGLYHLDKGPKDGYGPKWLAVSPDRKWIYISGLGPRVGGFSGGEWKGYAQRDRKEVAEQAIYRIPFNMKGKMELFVGTKGKPGKGKNQFSFPEGLGCDAQGNVYVCDTRNNRIQVFGKDRKFIKTINVLEPYDVDIHPKTGAIYILSYPKKLRYFKLIKLKSLKSPSVVAEKKLDAKKYIGRRSKNPRLLPHFCLDHWARQPTVWMIAPNFHVQLWEDKGKQFVLKRDLYEDFKKDWKGPNVHFNVMNIAADPNNPYIYSSYYSNGLRIHTETGAVETAPLVTVFGYDGLAYVRRGNHVHRFDPVTRKAVAFDYGEGRNGFICYRFSSAAGIRIGVGPFGDILFHDRNPPSPGIVFNVHVQTLNKMGIPDYMRRNPRSGGKSVSIKGYKMRKFYPGRIYGNSSSVLHFDPSGELKNNDLIQGVSKPICGLRMDLKGNVYVGIPFPKHQDGIEWTGDSVAKFGPEGGRFMHNGRGAKFPLKDLPKRPPDFVPYNDVVVKGTVMDPGPNGKGGYGTKMWVEGMHWSFGGYAQTKRTHCICVNGQFELDLFARSYIPESHRNSISVVDTNGNFILRFGEYGNQDDKGPEIRMAFCKYLSVTDKRLYLNDKANKRIISVDLKYHQDETVELK